MWVVGYSNKYIRPSQPLRPNGSSDAVASPLYLFIYPGSFLSILLLGLLTLTSQAEDFQLTEGRDRQVSRQTHTQTAGNQAQRRGARQTKERRGEHNTDTTNDETTPRTPSVVEGAIT